MTENFLARPHMIMGRDDVIHYAEVCTWIGGLSFAQVSGNKELTGRLVERFEPLWREERALIPTPKHVDWTVFGSLPLEIYMQTGDMRGSRSSRISTKARTCARCASAPARGTTGSTTSTGRASRAISTGRLPCSGAQAR